MMWNDQNAYMMRWSEGNDVVTVTDIALLLTFWRYVERDHLLPGQNPQQGPETSDEGDCYACSHPSELPLSHSSSNSVTGSISSLCERKKCLVYTPWSMHSLWEYFWVSTVFSPMTFFPLALCHSRRLISQELGFEALLCEECKQCHPG